MHRGPVAVQCYVFLKFRCLVGCAVVFEVVDGARGATMSYPGWSPPPAPRTGCPPGLEYLTMVDQLLIHQQVELLEGAYVP